MISIDRKLRLRDLEIIVFSKTIKFWRMSSLKIQGDLIQNKIKN